MFDELLEVSLVAAGGSFGDSIANMAGFQLDSLTTDIANRVVYSVRQTQTKKIVISKCALDANYALTGSWTQDQSDILVTNVDDSHNCISQVVDASGRLHVSGDMHGVEMNYWRAAAPGDTHIEDWFSVPIVAGEIALETSDTYPAFVRLVLGNLLWFFRSGASGGGDLVMRYWSDAANGGSDSWVTLFANLIDGVSSGVSAYPCRFAYKNGKLGVAWVWRNTPALNTNHDLCYMYALESGSVQTIPATQANAGYVEVIPVNTGLENVGGLEFDDAGNPVIAVNTDPGDGFTQTKLWYWDGAAWVTRWIPGNLQPYSYVDSSSAQPTFLMSPIVQLMCRGGRMFGLTRYECANNNGACVVVCEEPTYSNWTLYQLDSVDLRDWEANIDMVRFRHDGEIWAPLQRCAQPANPIGAQDLRVLRWRPPSSIPYVAPTAPWDPNAIPDCIDYINARVGAVRARGSTGSSRTRHLAWRNILTGAERYVQESNSDAPEYIWNAVNGRAATRFTASTLDYQLTSDSALFTQLNVVNGPASFVYVVQPLTLALNATFWGFGGSASHLFYLSCGGTNASAIAWGRRTGGSLMLLESAAGVLTANQWLCISGRSDGLGNAKLRVNKVEVASRSDWLTAGALAVNTGSLGCRRTTGNSLYNHHDAGARVLWNRYITDLELEAAEDALMAPAEFSIAA
jgi:hypothetical protein